MITSPIKIQRGMGQQLDEWRKSVVVQGHRLGWKIGFNMPSDQQRLNLPSAMLGYLSKDRSLLSGQNYHASANSNILVEPEIAIQINQTLSADSSHEEANNAIAAYAAALELVDTTRSVADDIEAVLGGNLFHERVLFSEQRVMPEDYRREQISFSLCLNGEEVRTLEQERVPESFATIIIDTANILAAHGEHLQAGDWIITGAAATPLPVKTGDEISLNMQGFGKLALSIK